MLQKHVLFPQLESKIKVSTVQCTYCTEILNIKDLVKILRVWVQLNRTGISKIDYVFHMQDMDKTCTNFRLH